MGAAADWSNDDAATKRERKAYWFTGFGTGPDTIMGVLWGAAFLGASARDGTCHPNTAPTSPYTGTSGADNQLCSAASTWNETHFNLLGGDACLKADSFGAFSYQPDPSLTGCQAVFDAYRAQTDFTGGVAFTCNCSGRFADHVFFGEGGLRPAGTWNLLLTVALLTVAFVSPIVGSWADFASNRLIVWRICCFFGAAFNFGMMVVGTNYLWLVGMVFAGLTAIFTEIQIPIRASYMEDVAFDNATRGYLGGMRQFASYLAQVIYAAAFGLLSFSDEVLCMIYAGACGTWYLVSMPCILSMFREHPAKRVDEKKRGVIARTFQELVAGFVELLQYPEAAKYLIALMCAQFGGPMFVTLISTYGPYVMERSGLYISIIGLCVLVLGTPGSLTFAQLHKRGKIGFKATFIVIICLNILIGALIPLLATGPDFTSYLLALALAGGLGAISISWFYSVSWPAFMTLIPAEKSAKFAGVHTFCSSVVQPGGTGIYFAVVQSTNNHQLAWALTTVPLSVVALVLFLFVDFAKGQRQAGRMDGQVGAKTPTTTIDA